MLFAAAPPAVAQPVTVVVNSTSSAIDGNTASIPSLIVTPGFDNAISLMEAIAAANNTPGPKTIAFSPALRGKSIPWGSNDLRDLFSFALKSGDLSIDGDVDGDGTPDVTLDASGNSLTTLRIRASNIVVSHLIFREFSGAINFACEDIACAPKNISNVRITGNVFDSQRGAAVGIDVQGMLGPSNAGLLSDFNFENIHVDHNTVLGPVDRFAEGIGVRACSDGVFNSRFTNIYVTDNHLRVNNAIAAGAADEPLPPHYSDNCLIDTLVIDGNLIEDGNVGIAVSTANLANQHNTIQHIRITNNRLLRTRTGMLLNVASLPDPTRATAFNTMTDLSVSGNEIADGDRGIQLSAGELPFANVAPTAVDDNTLIGAAIIGNNVHGYHFTGLQVYGAVGSSSSGPHSSSRNRIDGLTITGNTFEAAPGNFTSGLEIFGAQSQPNTAAANIVRRVTVAGNTFRGNGVALTLDGGDGPNATGNLLSLDAISPNTFDHNGADMIVRVDDHGASGNRIEYTSRRRTARH